MDDERGADTLARLGRALRGASSPPWGGYVEVAVALGGGGLGPTLRSPPERLRSADHLRPADRDTAGWQQQTEARLGWLRQETAAVGLKTRFRTFFKHQRKAAPWGRCRCLTLLVGGAGFEPATPAV